MITRFYISNFKSLVEFNLPLAKFSCLVGLNGAGKSTVLQALDFSSSLMSGDVETWLEKRNWSITDINSRLSRRSSISIEVDISIDGKSYRWRSKLKYNKLHCVRERLVCLNDKQVLLSVGGDYYKLNSQSRTAIAFQYQGSILSQLKPELLGEEIQKVKFHLSALRSLDLLSPHMLRLKARKTDQEDIGMGGEHLSAFIRQLTIEQKTELLKQLRAYYSQIIDIKTKTLRSGWVQLELIEQYYSVKLKTEARHINDGLLRLLAILAQQFSPLETLLFDEIENGINSEIIEKVVDALVASPKQIIVTTHSPMLLNYLEDEIAQEAVILLYKTEQGRTHAIRFFDLPSAADKLKSLAPGDAMLDLYLQNIANEAQRQIKE